MHPIRLEGVRVHNLQDIRVTIPSQAVTVICGVSGSGKSSLAFDTLFAEGQRRYAETFSPHVRQFLSRLERPDVDRITGLPPAVALRQQYRLTDPLATVGSRTDILWYLQQLFAQEGTLFCPECGTEVVFWDAERVADALLNTSCGCPAVITFPAVDQADTAVWRRLGFVRAVRDDTVVRLDDLPDGTSSASLQIAVDRIRLSPDTRSRLTEAIDQAFDAAGCVSVLLEQEHDSEGAGGSFRKKHRWTAGHSCRECGTEFPEPSPELLNGRTAAGACSDCQGRGLSGDSHQPCPSCQGTGLNPIGRSVRLRGQTLPDVLMTACDDLPAWLDQTESDLSEARRQALQTVFGRLRHRLEILQQLRLDGLAPARRLQTLSGGELRRVLLAAVLGNELTGTLYVLDEPVAGLHPSDVRCVIDAVRRLRNQGNTVVMVEHHPDVIRAADHVVELGPGAGQDGGRIVFEGRPSDLTGEHTPTGQLLAGPDQTGEPLPLQDAPPAAFPSGELHWLEVRNVHCHNIQDASFEIPLQCLTAVTGVSGSGRSALIVDALLPELQRELSGREPAGTPRCRIASGSDCLKDVHLLDQRPLPRSARSVPATWLGIFDDIRRLLADTHQARQRGYTAGTFSFNASRGGRCDHCQGRGLVSIDMQFLADVQAPCEVCRGRRFRTDVLEVRYRDRAVHEILDMTADEAFSFFTGQPRIQKRLNSLRATGLGYLTLGQSLSTLSGGEAQRLRIAAVLSGSPDRAERPASDPDHRPVPLQQRHGSLYVLDEPSAGLHARDTDRLLSCLKRLTEVGHTVIILEQSPRVLKHCDYLLEMGPGAGRHGGRIVRRGFLSPPSSAARNDGEA